MQNRPLPVERAPGFALRAAEQFRTALWRRTIGEFPSTTQLALMLALQDDSSSYQQMLAERINVDKATLTALIRALDRRGLVLRGSDPDDARRRGAVLGDDATELIESAMGRLSAVEIDLLSPLSPLEKEEVAELWKAVAAADGTDEPPARGDGSALEVLRAAAGWQLRRVRQLHSRLWETNVPALTPPQYAALDVLYYSGPLEVLATARKASLEESNGARILNRLASRGLVDRSPVVDDARRVMLSLTNAGEDALDVCTAGVRRVQHTLMRPLGEEPAARFHSLTARVARI